MSIGTLYDIGLDLKKVSVKQKTASTCVLEVIDTLFRYIRVGIKIISYKIVHYRPVSILVPPPITHDYFKEHG